MQIADLGVASFKTWSKLTKEEHNEQRKVTSTAKKNGGTLHYMAPEHLNDVNAKPSEKSDVYSFAIVLWAIFANKEPYESRHLQTGGWVRALTRMVREPPRESVTTGHCPSLKGCLTRGPSAPRGLRPRQRCCLVRASSLTS